MKTVAKYQKNKPVLPIIVIFIFFMLTGNQKAIPYPGAIYPEVEIPESELINIVSEMVSITPPRNHKNIESLNTAAQIIFDHFREIGYEPKYQHYEVNGTIYKNVIAAVGPGNTEKLIIGAHYDVYGDYPGADDNASGIAGLIVLARLLKSNEHRLNKTIELVAYTLEEPPYFRTEYMGSFIHAKSLKDHNRDVLGMISIDMIGYFSNQPDSQSYPLKAMALIYPSTADFIGVVGNFSSRLLGAEIKKHFSKAEIHVEQLVAPAALTGVDYSDHLNYWRFGYPAVLITDTAFFRNPHYHKSTDRINTLDLTSMKKVVLGLFYAVLNLGMKA